MSRDLYLVAGTAERTARIVWIGRDGKWQYDTPQGLTAFTSESDAKKELLKRDGMMRSIFGAVLGEIVGEPKTTTPTLRNLRVVTFSKKGST